MPLSLFRATRPGPAEPPDCGDGPDLPTKRPARRSGATALEYVFVASLIIVVAFSAINYFGQQTNASLNQTSNAIQKADNEPGP
jgi:Flp pilus assembly pilin Flp